MSQAVPVALWYRIGVTRGNSAAVVALLAACALTSRAGAPGPTAFHVSPDPALMDDRIAILVTGLPPLRHVTIRAASPDRQNHAWRSYAEFITTGEGSIDLTTMAPAAGSYTGVDAMGLFWSMQPDPAGRRTPAFFDAGDSTVTRLEAVSNGAVLATSALTRRFASAGVRAEPFRRDGVVGILYYPAGGKKHPAVILLGGSEGGIPTPEGPLLASRGFLVLALAYFGAPGLPVSMQRIPIEYFGNAIHAVQRLPEVDGARVALFGASRGAEAALIVGSIYQEVNGVIAVSGSNVRWEGATARLLPGGPAWTHEGKPLPFVPFHISPGFAARYAWTLLSRGALSLEPMFTDSLRSGASVDAAIPVERIHGPVLLASGARDRKWPSDLMSRSVIDRLRGGRRVYSDIHFSFQDAGHWLPSAYLPAAGLRGRMAEEIGGTPEGTADVQRRWWPEVLRFLAALPH